MATAPKADGIDRMVTDDLASALIEREAQLVDLRRQYDIQHDLTTALLALVRQRDATIAMLRRTIAELRGMPSE